MAHRFEKNQISGNPELVIDGWENGIADSPYPLGDIPYTGVANIRNLNIKYYKGVAYINYKRKACTISGGTMTKPKFSCESPAGLIYIVDSSGQVWKQNSVNGTTFTKITGNPAGGSGQGIAFWQNYLFVFRGNAIDICGDGTGDGGVTSSNWNASATPHNAVWPIAAPSSVVMTAGLSAGATSCTLSSYNDSLSNAQTAWVGPSGLYQMKLSNNQLVSATFTFNSTAVSFTPAVVSGGATSSISSVTPIFSTQNSTGVDHMSLISGNDGNLYFCNGGFIGALSVPSGNSFNLGFPASYNFSYAALALPQYETATWLAEQVANLMVAGVQKLYPWDRVSTSWKNPIPFPEPIKKILNFCNIVYAFCGQKGNIYSYNGYYSNWVKKIADYVTSQTGSGSLTSLIDPLWTWGGVMTHREKIYFQAFAQKSDDGTNEFSGIFSLDVSDPRNPVLNIENQSSSGINASTETGILIDNTPSANGNDSFYSGWSDTSTGYGIDYNDTTPYSGSEPMIETEIIDVGTNLARKTISGIEFKLDQPMKANESISIYMRPSLSDAYSLIGTTNSGLLLADTFKSIPIQQSQWLQFKITMSSASTAALSSFMRLRQIRIQYG